MVGVYPHPADLPTALNSHVLVGYHELLVGHGKVYDADDFRAVEGCHGSLNRLLCLSNEAVGRNCAWNRRPDGVRDNSKCIICTWLILVFRARYVISAALRVPSISLRIRTQPGTRRTVPMVLTFQFVAKISRPLRRYAPISTPAISSSRVVFRIWEQWTPRSP